MTESSRRADPASRRVIDVAIGILMGLRRCSERDAFDDLVRAVHETGVGPAALATALADIVAGEGDRGGRHTEATLMWGHLLVARAPSVNVAE